VYEIASRLVVIQNRQWVSKFRLESGIFTTYIKETEDCTMTNSWKMLGGVSMILWSVFS